MRTETFLVSPEVKTYIFGGVTLFAGKFPVEHMTFIAYLIDRIYIRTKFHSTVQYINIVEVWLVVHISRSV